jgi:hypothetical protein
MLEGMVMADTELFIGSPESLTQALSSACASSIEARVRSARTPCAGSGGTARSCRWLSNIR